MNEGDVEPASADRSPACCPATAGKTALNDADGEQPRRSGCTVCGAGLVYSGTDQDSSCCYCGAVSRANARCANGHYVCDRCHGADAVRIIQEVCLRSLQTDPAALMQAIRTHPGFPIHGPEHHPMVPAVILTALRNGGCAVTYREFITAIHRGQTIGGGSCAFLGACGAAIGAGIAVSLLLEATPYDGDKRQMAQRATFRALGSIASFNAPRCCQRDSWLALREASALIQELSGVSLPAGPFPCAQHPQNRECIREQCPLWPANQ